MLKKFIISLFFIFSFLALSGVVGLFFIPSAFASTLYLSPGSANIPQGTTRSVSVGINTTGESVNGVSAYLSYPSDKVEVAWVSAGSAFSIEAEGTYGGGSIRISRGSISGVVGNVTVATIGFRGKAQGTATVAFVGGSAAPRTSDSSDSLNLGGSAGGTYTVVAPQPVTPTPRGEQSTELLISNVKANSVSTNSATITWETNEKSDSTLEYGLSPNKYFLTIYDKTLTATHTAILEGSALTPGATFHFRVKSKDEKDNEAVSNDQAFQLKGYSVKVKITDKSNNPVVDVDVYLYTEPQKSRTDANGEVHFADVTPGKHLVVVKLKNNFDKTGEIEVLDSPLVQSFTLVVDTAKKKAGDNRLYIVLLVFIILAIVGVGVWVLSKRKQNPPVQPPTQTWQ